MSLISNTHIASEMERIKGLRDCPEGKAARRELALALAQAETDYQATAAITALIQQEDRRFCPSPGEILAAVRAAPLSPPEPGWVKPVQCRQCRDTGIIPGGEELLWCPCPMGQAERAASPGFLDEHASEFEKMRRKVTGSSMKRRRSKLGALTPTAQIIERLR